MECVNDIDDILDETIDALREKETAKRTGHRQGETERIIHVRVVPNI